MSVNKCSFSFLLLSRKIEESKKAEELAELASRLQETRAQRELEVQTPVNTLYQEELTIRQRELAQLARCGHPQPP